MFAFPLVNELFTHLFKVLFHTFLHYLLSWKLALLLNRHCCFLTFFFYFIIFRQWAIIFEPLKELILRWDSVWRSMCHHTVVLGILPRKRRLLLYHLNLSRWKEWIVLSLFVGLCLFSFLCKICACAKLI